MASTDAASLINMNFEIATYSQEALRFDGKKFATSQIRPGSRFCLNLPHTYKFHLAIQSEVRPAVVDWVFTLNDFSFTSPLDAAEFTFGERK